MPRFLVDAQLPPALARKLTALGHKAIHVLDVDLLEASMPFWSFEIKFDRQKARPGTWLAGRFLAWRQGEAEDLQGGACFLWFISLHEQRKNLPPGNPGLKK